MAKAQSSVYAWSGSPADLVSLARTLQDALRDVRDEVREELEAADDNDRALYYLDRDAEPQLRVRHRQFEHEEAGPVTEMAERIDWSDVEQLTIQAEVPRQVFTRLVDVTPRDERCVIRMSWLSGAKVEVFSGSDIAWVGRTHTTLAAHLRKGIPRWCRLRLQFLGAFVALIVSSIVLSLLVEEPSFLLMLGFGVLVFPIIAAAHITTKRFLFPGFQIVLGEQVSRWQRLVKGAGWVAATFTVSVAAAWVFSLLGR